MTNTPKTNEAGKLGLIGGVIAALIILPILIVGVLIATFDANKYREDISAALSQQLGRDVKLGGTMGMNISSGGVVLSVQDVTIGNPAWASRKEMAKIGLMEMRVAVAPLLQGQVEIQRFNLANADVQLETNDAGKGNWDIQIKGLGDQPAAAQKSAAAAAQETKPAAGKPISFAIEQVTVKSSNFAFRDGKAGKTTAVKLDDLNLNAEQNVSATAKGKFTGQDFSLNLKGGTLADLTGGKDWPLDFTARFAAFGVEGKGKLDGGRKDITLNPVTLDTPQGKLAGSLAIATGGVRPKVSGALSSEKMTLAAAAASDATAQSGTPSPQAEKAAAPSGRLFSDAPIDFSSLRGADANLDLAVGQIVAGDTTLDQLNTKLSLENGRMRLNPLDFSFAGNKFDANVAVDASGQTPQVVLGLKGFNLDTNSLLAKFGMDKVILGKANMDLNVNGMGNNPRAIASTLGGAFSLEVGNGSIPPEGMKLFAANALAKLLPGSEGLVQASLTCMSTKFEGSMGVMRAQGLVIDTNLGTVAGAGGLNFRDETIDMKFQPQPRQAELSQIAALPVRVTGGLTKPNVALEAAGAVKSLASNLLGVNVNQGGLQVPLIDPKTPGNPCTKALTSPVYVQQQPKPGLLTPQMEEAKKVVNEKVKGIANDLGKSLGIKLFGQ